jgi:flagellar biosynthesis protein FlhG
MQPGRFDQAQTLRAWSAGRGSTDAVSPGGAPTVRQQPVQVIAVASGKGGTGKTSLVTNLAVALARHEARVLALDGDLGLANLDFTFGVTPHTTVLDVLNGTARIEDTLVAAPGDVTLLPACHGRFELANLTEQQQYGLFSSIDTLDDRFDVLLVDTAAGIGANAVAFAAAAQQVVVVTTPEPTSLADSYSFVKVLRSRSNIKHVQVVANMVRSAKEGELLYQRLSSLFERFLDVSSQYLGQVPFDPAMSESIRAAVPLLLHRPDSPASLSILALAARLRQAQRGDSGGIRLFWRRLINQDPRPQPFAVPVPRPPVPRAGPGFGLRL